MWFFHMQEQEQTDIELKTYNALAEHRAHAHAHASYCLLPVAHWFHHLKCTLITLILFFR